jgi:hypothetical protein
MRRPVIVPRKRVRARVLGVFLVLGAHIHVQAQNVETVRVLPPHAEVAGKPLGEWAGIWWQWALSFPVSLSPVFDRTGDRCHLGQSGPVWFLAGLSSSDPLRISVVRECTVPPGKHILFPVFNGFQSGDPWDPRTCDEACDEPSLTPTDVVLAARINGVDVPDLKAHFESTAPGCFVIVLPAENEFGAPAGCYEPACATGWYLMLAPLPAGERVVIEFEGGRGDPKNCAGCVSITYLLTVSGFEQPVFRRGDGDGNGRVELSDAVMTLNHLFLGGAPLPCEDAADADDDGQVAITDAIRTLSYLFLGGCLPPWPGSDHCASDPTPDQLGECKPPASC